METHRLLIDHLLEENLQQADVQLEEEITVEQSILVEKEVQVRRAIEILIEDQMLLLGHRQEEVLRQDLIIAIDQVEDHQ
jgi:hypothetical protein